MSELPPLEELLLAACERGITHLTLYPVPSQDGKLTYWSCRGTPSTQHKYVEVNDHDPVRALRGVLLGLPKAPKRPTPGPGTKTPAQTEITATVTEARDGIEAQRGINDVFPGDLVAHPKETLDTWLPKT